MSDLNKKTLRHFYCRDVLWQCFERMSEDFDRGVDDLVNEAMRVFAREKGYIPAENEVRATAQHTAIPRPPPLPPPSRPSQALPRLTGSVPLMGPATAAAAANAEPPLEATAGPTAPLYLIFQNQRFLIDKEQFIIGRGAKTSDLPIRDGNISRKHCAVVRKNGSYFIKDLGSTNGIDFNGTRVDNKRIEEGDTYMICDYQLRFTYR